MADDTLVDHLHKALDRHEAVLRDDNPKGRRRLSWGQRQDGLEGIQSAREGLKHDLARFASMQPVDAAAAFDDLQHELSHQRLETVNFAQLDIPASMLPTLPDSVQQGEYYLLEAEADPAKIDAFIGFGYSEGQKPRKFQNNPFTPVLLMVKKGSSGDYTVLANVEDNRGITWTLPVGNTELPSFLAAFTVLPK